MDKHKSHSKFLSYVLRHHPQAANVTLDDAGWCRVDALLKGCAARGKPISLSLLQEIVATNGKQRFSFSEDGKRIRANQGHSVDIALGYTPVAPPDLLYHGTVDQFLESIRRQGLRAMNRHHVHLSHEVATAQNVGSRRGKAIVLQIDSQKMHNEGFEFFRSENGVWLTEKVPYHFISEPE